MFHAPAPYERLSAPSTGMAEPRQGELEVRLQDLWWMLRRSRWLILGCILVSVAVALMLLARAIPVYEAWTSLRIETRTPNLPEVTRSLMEGQGTTTTDMEELRSRSLAEEAVMRLGLQVTVLEPARVRREALFGGLTVSADARNVGYLLERRAGGRFVVIDDSGARVGNVAPGQRVAYGGVSFTLGPAASELERISFRVRPLASAASAVRGGMTVARAGRESNILTVRYQGTDPELVWQVPNAVVGAFVARRQSLQKAEARSTITFLREQLDTVNRQLAGSEEKLRRFREWQGVIDPVVEANSQIDRLVSLQSERGTLDAERAALGKLMAEVQAEERAGVRPGAPSPYRRLVAFPTLLRNRMSADLLRSLMDLENQRNALLVRRTERDPDVQALTERIESLEREVRGTTTTYLEGLTNQVGAIDSTLGGFDRQLAALPQKQVQYARLDRQPKVLEQISTLLQTRLKEAEVAEAVEDASVRVVDPAIAPTHPVKPRRPLYLLGGLVAGLMLGIIVALMREFLDTSVHTRADVRLLTGLPVMGLIPRIRGAGTRAVPLIAEREMEPDVGPGIRGARATAGRGGHGGHPMLVIPSPRHRRRHASSGRTGHPRRATGGTAPTQRFVVLGAGNAAAEAYGVLQTNIVHSRHDAAIRTVVFTSALPGEGKTTSAINLALTLTHRGLRVLLIDADLRRGVVHQVFDAPRGQGLTDVLRGTVPFDGARQEVEVGGMHPLHLVTTGSATARSAGLIDSEPMRQLLQRCREEYDVVILDVPPVNVIADAALLSVQVDGVVIVVRAGVTESAALVYALEQLRHVEAPVLGVVLNDIDFRKEAAYDPTYRYCDYGQYAAVAE